MKSIGTLLSRFTASLKHKEGKLVILLMLIITLATTFPALSRPASNILEPDEPAEPTEPPNGGGGGGTTSPPPTTPLLYQSFFDACPQCGAKLSKNGFMSSNFHAVFSDHKLRIQKHCCKTPIVIGRVHRPRARCLAAIPILT